METYESIKQWKDANILSNVETNDKLNDFHDQVMLKVLEVAKSKMKIEKTPCDFTWFITGSGGRIEQGLISDQDHGIVYEISNEMNDKYFKELGEEVSFGLDVVGYPFCKGQIMSSNPTWCKSLKDWENQLTDWMEDESWEVIRYLQIFYDARVLYGKSEYIHYLKTIIFHYLKSHPNLLKRVAANMKHMKNVIGPMGQIVVEQYGLYQGCINLKYTAFLPYVNSIRLLSIKEGVFETATKKRIEKLIELDRYRHLLTNCDLNFSNLTKYRMSLPNVANYDESHYLSIKRITREQRKELKQILKQGKKLHEEVIALTLAD